jgi:secreted trypsin-like serine protease
VSPICLPDISGKGSIYENKEAIVAGWGSIRGYLTKYELGPRPDILQEATLMTMTNDECFQAIDAGMRKFLSNRTICATNKDLSTCKGDSGGPLVIQDGDSKSYTIVGIVSFGNTNCTVGQQSGFARVTAELDWIKNNIQGSRCL